MRSVKSWSLFLLLFAAAAPLVAQMDATMKRGDTQTFTVPFNYTVQTFAVNSTLVVTIGGSPELTLGHTTLPGFNCTESPDFTICVGAMGGAGSQTINITQVLSVRSVAARPSTSWTIQLVGDGLSGLSPKSGVITIPDPAPKIVVTKLPEGMVAILPSSPLDPRFTAPTTTVEVTNVGEAGTNVSLTIPEPFAFVVGGVLQQSVQLNMILPHQTASAEITGNFKSEGYFAGAITATGSGVPPDTFIPVRLVITKYPSAPPLPQPTTNRKDVSSPANGPNPTGSVRFTNNGAGVADGVLFSDSPWLIVLDSEFSLQPGESKDASFTVDVAKELQALSSGSTGAATASLTFRFLIPTSNKTAPTPLGNPPGTGSVSVTLVSTITPPTANASIPPLPDIHGQIFLAGVGHAQGSVGLFISDLAIFPQVMRGNASFKSLALSDVDLYYTPLGGGTSSKATLAALAPPNVAAFGDLVATVYGANAQIGSLQIRTPGYLAGEGAVGVSANVFNVSGKTGTYGTSIPVFTFDKFRCGQDLTKKLYLTGLRKDASGHTNFYVQETCGSNAKVTLDFYDPTGNKIGSTTADVPAFAAIQLGTSVVPNGAVSAILSHASGSSGGFVAYATPVDEASGDTWAQVDWPNLRGYSGNAAVVVPVAGALPGANNTYFRTDLSIMNTGSTAGSGTLRFYNRTGETIDRTITLNPLQTATYIDVTTTLFGIATPHVGYLVFTPASGTFVLTSRNYSTPVGSNATFGTAVPTLAVTSAIRPGQVRRIGGIEDASPDTIGAQRGATYRSNFGLIETTGQPATVKVTAYYTYTSGLTSTVTGASTTIDLSARQFVLLGVGGTIFGANRASLGDLHNITLEFEVIGGTGNVVPFVSSVDNGSGDSTFRTE